LFWFAANRKVVAENRFQISLGQKPGIVECQDKHAPYINKSQQFDTTIEEG